MTKAQVVSALKATLGVAFSLWLSASYAKAFAYTSGLMVWGAMTTAFALLTAPVWMSLFGRPVRRWFAYYLVVAAMLFMGVIARFVIEGLAPSA